MSDRTYAVQYWSASKGAFQDIAAMPTPHIRNAIKKLEALIGYYEGEQSAPSTQPNGDAAVLEALKAELEARGSEEKAPARQVRGVRDPAPEQAVGAVTEHRPRKR